MTSFHFVRNILAFLTNELDTQVSECKARGQQACGPGCLGPCDCTTRRDVIQCVALWMVLNVFSREAEHTFQIKQENVFLHNPSESG